MAKGHYNDGHSSKKTQGGLRSLMPYSQKLHTAALTKHQECYRMFLDKKWIRHKWDMKKHCYVITRDNTLGVRSYCSHVCAFCLNPAKGVQKVLLFWPLFICIRFCSSILGKGRTCTRYRKKEKGEGFHN